MADTILNSTFDLEAITQALIDIKADSHYNLLSFQSNNIGVDRVDMPLNRYTGKQEKSSKGKIVEYAAYHFNYDFIMTRNHIRYKNSEIYDKIITLKDVDNNRHIFNKIPLVFINGCIVDFVKLRVLRNELFLLIDKNDYPMNTVTADDDLTVLFVPNNEYNPYHSEYSVIKKYKSLLNPYYISEYKIKTDTEANYTKSVQDGKFYFRGIHKHTGGILDQGLKYDTLNANADLDKQKVYLNIASIRSFITRLKVISTNGHNYVESPKMKMPIPKENILPIKLNDDGSFTLDSDIRFGESYHGIYEVENMLDDDVEFIYCMVFYNYERDDFGDADGYLRHTDLYTKVMNITAKNIDTEAKDIYRNYDVDKVTYGTDDYHSQNLQDNVKYRLDKLREVIEKYPMMYSKYLQLLADSVDGFYIDLTTVDYDSKLRMNSDNEAIPGSSITKRNFVTERLLIILKNEDRQHTRLRIYVDGVLYIPDFTIEKGIYDLYYIPTTMAKKDSIIEVENMRYTLNRYDYEIKTLDDIIYLDNPNKGIKVVTDKARISDLYVSVKSTGKYLKNTDFDIYYKDALMDPGSNLLIDDDILIRINNKSYEGSTLTLSVGKVSFMKEVTIKTETSMDDYVRFKLPMKPNKKFIRFYRNYRLINPDLYTLSSSESSIDYSYGFSGIRDVVGDVFTVDYSSTKYEVEYSASLIPSHGLLDLRGKLDRPLSFKWYDFYLNGKRLNPKSAEILSPYLMRINKNVKSLKNFFIVSRDSDNEVISIRNNKTITESLLDVDKEFEARLKNQVIDDSEPDIITEITESIDFELPNLYLDVLLSIDFINPDENQLDDIWYSHYTKYYEEDKKTMLLGKVNGGVDSVMINPDEEKKEYDTTIDVVNPQ